MRKIVIILGAGASIPYGYPSGPKLVELIIDSLHPNYFFKYKFTYKDLNHDEPIPIQTKQAFTDNSLLVKRGFSQKEILDFGTALLNSNKDSIDSFLLERKEYYEIGKFTIANCILQCENPNEYQFVSKNWLKYLWNKIGTSYNQFISSNLSFISFNYDRLIEHFFYQSLKYSFNLTDTEINKLITNRLILHLHGSVGLFPWQDNKQGFDYYTSGQDFNSQYDRVVQASNSIKIIFEKFDSSEIFEDAFELICSADEVYTLGFGFHSINLRRLNISEVPKTIKCSAFGLTDHECDQIEITQSDKLALDKNHFDNLDFLRNYLDIEKKITNA